MSHHSPTRFIPAAEALPALIAALPADEFHAEQFQFTRDRQAAFLRRLADCGEIRSAARASAVSHQTIYRLRRSCATFRRACHAALLIARELAEDALATRAMNGVEEEVFYHGEVVAVRRRHDSRLLLAHLARLDRLEGREDVAAMVGEFDALVDAMAAGDDAGAEAAMARADAAEQEPEREAEREYGAGEAEPAAEPSEELPFGPCNMRSMSHDEPDDLGGLGDLGELAMEDRLAAMDEARPLGAVTPGPKPRSIAELDALEAAQMTAFEAGDDRWWAVNPLTADELESDRRVPMRDQTDLLGGAAAEVDGAAPDERPAVVDAHRDGAVIAAVGDANHGAKG